MAAENKFDKLRSMVHQGVPLEKTVGETMKKETEAKSVDTGADNPIITEAEPEMKVVEPTGEIIEPVIRTSEPTARPAEKRKRKPQADYQSLFF